MSKPIRRHIALQPLSREHHNALMLCYKIRQGLIRKVEFERIGKYVTWFAGEHLQPHFATEEKYIFPLLGNEHDLVKKALDDHRSLEALFYSTVFTNEILEKIELELDNHVRFEERILFNEIQDAVSPAQLEEAMKLHVEDDPCENWPDEFWNQPLS